MSRLKRVLRVATNQRGFTVTEVIVALGVLTVGLIALVSAMPLNTSQIAEANFKTTATFLAKQRMEQARSALWSNAPAADCLGASANAGVAPITASWANCPGVAPAGLVTFPDEAFNAIANYPGYQRQVRILDCSANACGALPADAAQAGLRQVTITVSFRPMTGTGTLAAGLENVQVITFAARQQ